MSKDLATIPSFSEVFKCDKNSGEMSWCGISDIKPGDMIASAGLVNFDNEMYISFDEVVSVKCSKVGELVRYDGLIINREAPLLVFDENIPNKICDNMCYDDLTDNNAEFHDNVPCPGRLFRGGHIKPIGKNPMLCVKNIGSMELSENEIHFMVIYKKYAKTYDSLHIPIEAYSHTIEDLCVTLGFDVTLTNKCDGRVVELLLSGGDIFVLLDEFYNYITIKEDTHGITVGYDSRLLWLTRKCFETFMYYDDNYKTSVRDDTLIKTFMAMNTCHFTKGIDSPNTAIYENHCFKDNTPFGDISDINGSEDLITLYGIQTSHLPYIMIKQGDNIFIVNDMLNTFLSDISPSSE